MTSTLVPSTPPAIALINDQISSLKSERRRLILQCVRSCSHPLIANTNNTTGWCSWHGHNVCLSCGLSVPADGWGVPHTDMLNLRESRVVRLKNGEELNALYHLSDVQLYALQFPKRFNPTYLATVLEDTPWSAAEVMAADHRYYQVLWGDMDGLFETLSEWSAVTQWRD